MKLADLKNRDTDRKKVNDWLDRIGETDPKCREEVLQACAKDLDARKYYVRLAEQK